MIQDYKYRVFGEPVVSGSDLSVYTYTGREYERDSGLYYYRSRYYDPKAGRFINKDLSRKEMNLYAYVQNNPVNYSDPWGEATMVLSYEVPTTPAFKTEAYSGSVASYYSELSSMITRGVGSEILADMLLAGEGIGVDVQSIMYNCIADLKFHTKTGNF